MRSIEVQLSLVSGDKIAVSLDYKRRQPVIERWQISRSLIDDIYTDLLEIVEKSVYRDQSTPGSSEGKILEELKTLGGALFQSLFRSAGDEFKQEILQSKDAQSIIFQVDRQLAYIPLEILFDGENFVSLCIPMGRRIFADEAVRVRSSSGGYSVLIVGDPTDDPAIREDIEKEVDALKRIFAREKISMTIAAGTKVDETYLLRHLPTKTLFHFSGHGVISEEATESGILLSNSIMSGKSLSGLQNPPAIAFFNMCTGSWNEVWRSSLGVIETLLKRGTQCCIATLWDIHSHSATSLACRFYQDLLDGKTIGEALLHARLDAVEKAGIDDITWAAFALYGDPDVSLEALLRPYSKGNRMQAIRLGLALAVFLASLLLPSKLSREPMNVGSRSFGYIVASSEPQGATIIVDDSPVGVTPSAVEVTGGSHKITIIKEGFRSWEAWVEVSPSKRTVIEATLEELK